MAAVAFKKGQLAWSHVHRIFFLAGQPWLLVVKEIYI